MHNDGNSSRLQMVTGSRSPLLDAGFVHDSLSLGEQSSAEFSLRPPPSASCYAACAIPHGVKRPLGILQESIAVTSPTLTMLDAVEQRKRMQDLMAAVAECIMASISKIHLPSCRIVSHRVPPCARRGDVHKHM